MTKFSKEGLRFIIGILIGFLTLVVATSVLVSGFRELAKSISDITVPGGSTPVDVTKETYRVDFNVMGGTLTGSSFVLIEEGKSVTAFPVATKAGYVFLGWFTGITPSDVLFTSSAAVNQDMTLFARFAEVGTVVDPTNPTYRVTFNVMGGTLSGQSSVTIEQGKAILTFPAASKDGFVFLGWFTGITPNDILVTANVVINQDITLFARWAQEGTVINTENPTYRVTFNVMGGTLSGSTFLTIEEGKPVIAFPAATKAGFTFLGWFTGITPNDVLFTSNIPVVQDLTLFARWQEESTQEPVQPGVETYRVAFETDGGQPVSSIQVRHNGTISLPSVTKVGFVFLGWYTGYLPGDILFTSQTEVTRNMTLYAVWERESFMITFIGNGGSFTQPLIAKATSNIEAPVAPKRLNHQFEGWFIDQALTEAYVFDTMPTNNVTLYAKFTSGTDEGVEYSCSATECAIVGFESFHTQLTIPALKNGLPVTSIADFAFRDANKLSSIVFLGDDLESIGTGAFENASLLSSFTLPESVTVIKSGAFKNASSLTTFDITTNMTSIGQGILEGASSLRSITVPLFGTNPSLQPVNIKYYFGGTTFDSSVALPISLVKVTITDGITSIPNNAFRDILTIKEVHLPASITSVGTNVLQGTFVEKLTWTFTGTEIASANSFLAYAFGGAHNNQVTNVPNTLKSITLNETPYKTISSHAFYNVASLEEIVIPDSFTVIQPFAFAHFAANTSSLQSITLPANLVAIGNSAFQNSGKLRSLTIPATVATLGTSVLQNTVDLESLTIGGQLPQFLRFYFGGTSATAGGVIPAALKHVTITNTTSNILPTSYFQAFTTLETITLPNSITEIQSNAFNGTTNLKSVVLPANLVTLGVSTFQASGIETIVIPNSVTILPNDTFRGAIRLTSVTLPNGLVTMGFNVFFDAINLTSLSIPSTVTSIGTGILNSTSAGATSKIESITVNLESFAPTLSFLRYLFGGTSTTAGGNLPQSLKTVNLTSTALTAIPNGFFQSFATIETITLSNTFTTMGTDVFNGTTLLKNVTLPTSLTNIGNNAFLNSSSMLNINIPKTVTTIGNTAFRGTTSLTSFEFPESLVSIGTGVFQESGLIAIEIPTVLTAIPNDTFFGATNLLDVTMHNGITNIGANAFRGTKITEISLSNQLTTIQAGAFQDAVGLESLSIPSSVITMGTNVLTGTTSLEELTLHIESLPSATRFLRYLYGGTSATLGGTLPTGLKTVQLEATTVTLLTQGFFQNFNTIETINVSNTFTSMGTFVFSGTTALQNVKLSTNITRLEDNTFAVSGLKTYVVPSQITFIANNVFQLTPELTSLTIHSGVTSIGTGLITGAAKLETLTYTIDSVTAPANQHLGYLYGLAQTTGTRPTALKTVTLNSNLLTVLPVSYFHNFGSIVTVNLDEKFVNISNSAFFGTTSLENFDLPVGLTTLGTAVFQNSGIKSVVIPAGITTIPADTFNNATQLTTATLHDNITSIGINAFFNTKITSINLTNQLLAIGNSAFQNATELTSIAIPNTVTSIGTLVLQGTTNLQTLTVNVDSLPAARRDLRFLFGGSSAIAGGVIPNDLKTVTLNATAVDFITNSFFEGFSTIVTVNLSNVFTQMGTRVFAGMTSLKTLVLPNLLIGINNDTFTGTTSLDNLVIPASVTVLAGNALRGMSTTAKIYFEGSLPTIALNTTYVGLFGTNNTIEVYVLASNIESFKTVTAFNDLFVATPSRLLTYTPGE
jgi:uncharacterized repeat protein (TIGR02543 family)